MPCSRHVHLGRAVASILVLLASGCSEYGIANGDRNTGGGAPDALVDPLSSVTTACGATSTVVAITNQGDANLEVQGLDLVGTGWSLLDAPALPVTLAAGEQLALTLQGEAAAATTSTATLSVTTDDSDQPVIDVSLQVTGDAPPAVSILSPTDAEVLSGGAATLSGQVSDAEDSNSALTVTWASSVDGELYSGAPQADGSSTVEWASGRADGNHEISFAVVDSCGNSAVAVVGVCQQAGYIEDELSLESWQFEGSAGWDETNGWLELTTAAENVVGTAFQTGTSVTGDNVEIALNFWIGGGSGADGLSLTALDSSRATTFLGGTGCGLGYGGDAVCTAGPALPGWSLEVDTYFNDGQDPTSQDHLAFTFDGDVDDPAVWVALPEIEDNGWHTMTVSVAAPRLVVTIDGTDWIDEDVAGFTAFPAWVGFTAGTGSLTNSHLIDSLEVIEYACPE
jgi:hypothetical protein